MGATSLVNVTPAFAVVTGVPIAPCVMTAAAVPVRIVNRTVPVLIANLLRWCRVTILPRCCHAVQHGACAGNCFTGVSPALWQRQPGDDLPRLRYRRST